MKRQREAEINEARQINALHSRPGEIILQTQYHYRDKAAKDKHWRQLKGFRNISVCSGAKKWKYLSPVYIGPIKVEPDLVANSLEHLWHYSQVFAEDLYQDQIRAEWFHNRRYGFESPLGKPSAKRQKHGQPLFWFWRGKRLSLVEARREIYCKVYAEHVAKLYVYADLRVMLKQGYNIQLFGYDAYDFGDKDLVECLEDTSRPFGHEFVLYGLLTDQLFWQPITEQR